MTYTTRAGGNEMPPAQPEPGVLYGIVGLGTHLDRSELYGDRKREQIAYLWQLRKLDSEGRPFRMVSFYTFSLHEKARLRKHLVQWRGRDFAAGEDVPVDLALGKSAMLTIVETASGKRKIDALSRLPEGVEDVTPAIEPYCFVLQDPDWAVFERLPEFLVRQIKASDEWPQLERSRPGAETSERGEGEDFDDDIPF